jgi:hypothetical protein
MENEKDLIEQYRKAVAEKKKLEIVLAKVEEVEKIKKESFENKQKELFAKYKVSSIDAIKKIRGDKLIQMGNLVDIIKKEFGEGK